MSELTSQSIHAVRTTAVAVALVGVIWLAGRLSHGLVVFLGLDPLVDGVGSAVLFFVSALLALFAFFLLYSSYYAVTE